MSAKSSPPKAGRALLLVRTLLLTLGIVFLSETSIMLVLPLALPNAAGSMSGALADAVGLSILCAPLLWMLVVKPLQRGIASEQARFRQLIEVAPDGLLGTDTAGRIVLANSRIEELFGWQREDLLGRPIEMLIPERFRERHRAQRQAYVNAPAPRGMGRGVELWGCRSDGSEFPVDISLGNSMTPQGSMVLAAIRDVSGRRKIEQELREANETLQRWLERLERRNQEATLMNEMGDILQACQTSDEAWRVASDYARRILPVPSGGLYALDRRQGTVRPISTWGTLSGQRDALERHQCWALRLGRPHRWRSSESGAVCSHAAAVGGAGCLCVPIRAQDEAVGVIFAPLDAGGVGGLDVTDLESLTVGVAERIGMAVANVELREGLRQRSIRDGLTGLFNRRHLDEHLEAMAQGGHAGPVAFLLFDVDLFKKVNDAYGHAAGDRVLQSVARVLTRWVRPEDLACRYGGEEFLVVMPTSPAELALERAESIRKDVERMTSRYEGATLPPVTISAGVALLSPDGGDPRDAVRAADAALYQAKAGGRNRVVLAEEPKEARLTEGDARRAVGR